MPSYFIFLFPQYTGLVLDKSLAIQEQNSFLPPSLAPRPIPTTFLHCKKGHMWCASSMMSGREAWNLNMNESLVYILWFAHFRHEHNQSPINRVLFVLARAPKMAARFHIFSMFANLVED